MHCSMPQELHRSCTGCCLYCSQTRKLCLIGRARINKRISLMEGRREPALLAGEEGVRWEAFHKGIGSGSALEVDFCQDVLDVFEFFLLAGDLVDFVAGLDGGVT